MFQELTAFDHVRFNSLPTIESADAEMRGQDKLNVALRVLEPIFVKHAMCDSWGISLLHKHWSVEPGELPITELNASNTRREYDLRPRTSFDKNFYPSIVAVTGDENPTLEPMEFSGVEGQKEAVEDLRAKPEFIGEVCAALTANQLEKMFGLATPRSVADGFELVEFTYEGRSSVSKELPSHEVAGMKVIETGWMFSGLTMGKCVKSCFAKCNVPGHTPSHSPAHNPNG